MKPVLLLLLAVFALQPQRAGAAAQVVSEAPTVQPGARTFRIHSERTGGDYLVEVTAPPLPALPGQRFPALYALDGGYGLVGPTARFLVSLAAVDAVYVVSIDSPPDQPAARDRDMLYRPSRRNGAPIGGGGAAFQAFLTEELRPLLERRFPLDPDRTVLFGHSLTGLFTASLLAERPDAFSGYVVASPSATREPDLVARVAAAAPRGGGRPVLIAAGGNESEGIRQRAAQLQAALSAPGSGFRPRLELFEGAEHVDYYPKLAAVALGATAPRSKPVPVQVPATQPPDLTSLARHVGRYSLADGRTFSLAMRQGGLALEFPGLPGGALTPAENGRFFVRGQEVDVLLGEGPDARLRVYGYEALGQRLPGP